MIGNVQAVPPEVYNRIAVYRTVSDVDYDAYITDYYPSYMGFHGELVGSWNPIDTVSWPQDGGFPFESELDLYDEIVYLVVSRSSSGSGIYESRTYQVYYYGVYRTEYEYSGSDHEGTVCYLQVLGEGHVQWMYPQSYSYYIDTLYESGDLWLHGFRYYCQDEGSYYLLSESMLSDAGLNLSYDNPPIIPYPGMFNEGGILSIFYNIGIFVSTLGDRAIDVLTFDIAGTPFFMFLFGGFFIVYMGWCIVKWAIPL